MESMIQHGLIERKKIDEFFHLIEKDLIRYPAIDKKAFGKKVENFLKQGPK